MKALVVGFGSIGQRHARVLQDLGCPVAVVSRRQVDYPRSYLNLSLALIDWRPDYVVIASRTHEHHSDLADLIQADFTGRVLVEKPLFEKPRDLPLHQFSYAAVAYNLRFHPLVLQFREFLLQQPSIISAHAYVGQYLPQWRPGADYRESYSSRRVEGGGVLRDLSHELDYVAWLLGRWTRLTAIGGHFSPLEIDSDDVFSILMSTHACPITTVQLNYLDRTVRRELIVQSDEHTARLDFISGTLEIDGQLSSQATLDRDHTYQAEHRAMLDGNMRILCTFEQGFEILTTIDAAERAAETHEWIIR